MALALLRAPLRPWSWRPPLVLGALALLTGPFGSADHTNYAAYGRIVVQGGDPYLVPPEAWAGGLDPVTSAVEPPWTETVSVYGPFATALHALSSLLGGDSMRQTVWVWQVITVLGWLAVRWILLRTAADRGRVDMLWTANPLVFGVGVLGAHLDVVAAALALAALVVAARSPLVAGVLTGLAVSTKITFGLVGVAVLLGWLERDRARIQRRGAVYAAAAAAVVVPLHLWAGPHVFDQLGRARRSVSLATPWRLLVDWLTGPLPSSTVRSLVFAASVVLFALFAVMLARLTAGRAPATVVGAAVRWALVLSTAYALAAPYSLPWYDHAHLGKPSRSWRPAPSTWCSSAASRRWPSPTCRGGWSAMTPARGGPHPRRPPQRACRMPCCSLWGVLIVVWRRASRGGLTRLVQQGRHADGDDEGHGDESPRWPGSRRRSR